MTRSWTTSLSIGTLRRSFTRCQLIVEHQPQLELWSIAAEECLFQVVLRCWPKTGTITRYPAKPHLYTDQEAEELELLYRGIPVYAIGHGAAAIWMHAADSSLRVQTSFLP